MHIVGREFANSLVMTLEKGYTDQYLGSTMDRERSSWDMNSYSPSMTLGSIYLVCGLSKEHSLCGFNH